MNPAATWKRLAKSSRRNHLRFPTLTSASPCTSVIREVERLDDIISEYYPRHYSFSEAAMAVVRPKVAKFFAGELR